MSRRTDASSPSGGVKVTSGTYTGDGAATQAIVGVGFQPKFIMVYPHTNPPGADYAVAYKADSDGLRTFWWWRGGPNWYYDLDVIISLDADGFTVGDGTGTWANAFNALEIAYTYLCWG